MVKTGKSVIKRNLPTYSNRLTIKVDSNKDLKIWIWIYFLLWIFEGALRKWVVPALSQPLLIIRDPIVLGLMISCYRREIIQSTFFISGMIALGVLSLITAMTLGHGNIWVAIYGARILLLYFPMIFIIGSVFNRSDVISIGKALLLIAIPMAILLFLQFYSPQSAWVNKSVGGDSEGAGFGGAMGYFRAPCTFSFTNGTTYFFSLVCPFVLYFWLNPKLINRAILICATGALAIAIPLSISRGLFFQVAVSIIFLFLAIARNPKYVGKIIIAILLIIPTFLVLSRASFFQTATEVFTSRFESGNESEGGVQGVLGDRFLGSLIKAVVGSSDQSVFGYGIGSGTSLGANLLNTTKILDSADFEWQRIIGELGFMGLFVIGFRVALAYKMSIVSYRKLATGDMLPWLLMSLGVLIVLQCGWGQSTSLGFFSLVGGLWLASMKRGEQ